MRLGPGGWVPGTLALAIMALLFFPSLSVFHSTGWGGSSQTSEAAGCGGMKSKVGHRGVDAGAVPREASLQVVLASSSSADSSWVQRTVDGIRSKSSLGVLVYWLPNGGTVDAEAATAAEDQEEEEEKEEGRGTVNMHSLHGDSKGQEAAAFLDAIISGYLQLPDVMAFLHGYSSRHSRVPNDWVLQHLLRRHPTSLLNGYLGAQCRAPDGEYGFRLLPTNVSANTEWMQPAARHLAQAWEEFFGEHLGPLPAVISAPCCAEFVATAAAIQSQPREFYVGARAWLDSTALSSKQAARVLEHTWHLILQPKVQLHVDEGECLCALYGVPTVRYWGSQLLVLLAVPPVLAALCVAAGPLVRMMRGPMGRRRPSVASI